MWTWRVYFKRAGKHPYVWSVDAGHIKSQKVVKNFRFGSRCKVYGGRDKKPIENSPMAFVAVRAHQLEIKEGIAYFT